jgi:hypothetical protein
VAFDIAGKIKQTKLLSGKPFLNVLISFTHEKNLKLNVKTP